MPLASIQDMFWVAGLVAHLILFFVLWKRARAKDFPYFTALIVTNIVKTIVLNRVRYHGSGNAYRVTYFGFAILDLALQLCVTHELASHVFAPTGKWAPDIRKGFAVVAAFSVLVASLLACLPTPPEKTLLKSILDRGNVFSSALLCELFVGMIAFSVTARLPWKTHVARITQGLGFYSLVGILTESGHSVLGSGTPLSLMLTFVRMTTYLICATYWIVTLWRDPPAPRELPDEMRQQLFTLQRLVAYDLRKLRSLKR
ncbi:hypothetical protein [Edaphobacter aggregans]|uniref:hypothetical protein n=1 Tax=Edaphobacter aggregans TaxID=570835 RepID=UPI001FE0677F|nr:hypothetical protein [Edaphobacter aggregans]